MSRVLMDFVGHYKIMRKIIDTRSQAECVFEGKAEVELNEGGVVYREHGQLIMGEQRFEAERTYLWRMLGPRVQVLFEDGRLFHDFDPVAGGKATEHLCGADWYYGGYEFRDWPVWSVTWDVEGPRKLYRSVTTFVPSERKP